MVIFHSYVKLPEGTFSVSTRSLGAMVTAVASTGGSGQRGWLSGFVDQRREGAKHDQKWRI